MAILAGLISMASRFAGQLLNTTLGWATLLLFGKVPQHRQILLLVMVFGSLVWVALVAGVLVPTVGTFLIAAVPRPDFIDENWIRLGMLVGALLVPLLIGIAAVFITESAKRPKGIRLLTSIVRGYPFALALAIILVLLAVVATVRKVRSLARRWEDVHVPVIVKPGAYDQTLRLLQTTLSEAGLPLVPRDAGPLLSGPPKLLDLIAGRALGDLVPDRLMLLVGSGIEILVYPSDIAISGTRDVVAQARASIVSRMLEAPAYLTSSAEAQRFEDELERLGAGAAQPQPQEVLRHVRSLDERLARLVVPPDEWETLYRMRLQLERDAFATVLGLAPAADAMAATESGGVPVAQPNGIRRVDLAIGFAGMALLALDIAVSVASRRRHEAESVATKGRF